MMIYEIRYTKSINLRIYCTYTPLELRVSFCLCQQYKIYKSQNNLVIIGLNPENVTDVASQVLKGIMTANMIPGF